jgi:hypothetical protein
MTLRGRVFLFGLVSGAVVTGAATGGPQGAAIGGAAVVAMASIGALLWSLWDEVRRRGFR